MWYNNGKISALAHETITDGCKIISFQFRRNDVGPLPGELRLSGLI